MAEETVVTTETPTTETITTEVVEETITPLEATVVEPEEKKVVPLAALEAERKKRQELAEQVAYMKGKLETVTAPAKDPEPQTPQTPQRPAKPVKPRADQFEEWSDYERAEAQYESAQDKYEQDLESYMIEKADYEVTQRLEQRVTQQTQAKTQAQIERAFEERMKKAAETDPELPLLITDTSLPVSTAMAEAIKESEVGPEILRFLANNREMALKIAQMAPTTANREMGKIEHQIMTTPKTITKKVSGAPDPITTVTPKGVAEEFDPEKAPMEDYYKARMQQLYRTG